MKRKNIHNTAEQEFKKIFPKLYQKEKEYEDYFGIAVNKYTRMHNKLYPRHKDNPIIHAHPEAYRNPKLTPYKKVLEKYTSIYENYGRLIVKYQNEFIAKYGHSIYSMLFNKYKLEEYV